MNWREAWHDLCAGWHEPYPKCCVLRFAFGTLVGDDAQVRRGSRDIGPWNPLAPGVKHRNAYVLCGIFHRDPDGSIPCPYCNGHQSLGSDHLGIRVCEAHVRAIEAEVSK